MALEIISPDFQVSFAELCSSTNMSTDYMLDLVEYNIIVPTAGTVPQEWQFNITAVRLVNKAVRLHRDLAIDWADIALIINLLEEIDQLKNENRQLKQQINRFTPFNN